METWQFTLFFSALLVGMAVIHVRVSRFDVYLRDLNALKSIDTRIQSVLQNMPQVDAQRYDRIETLLVRLHEDLEDLREATQHVQDAVVQIPPPIASTVVAGGAMPDVSSGERLVSLVESRLLMIGYRNLRILTDLRGAAFDGDLEVQVECERNGMPQKGRVLVRNGSIRDVALQSAAPMFP
ncbi:MAG: hypothetical protein NT107_03625 [Planctomycetota bacterium]|nr:hypothetical protein [Planctomycetota bacterium]